MKIFCVLCILVCIVVANPFSGAAQRNKVVADHNAARSQVSPPPSKALRRITYATGPENVANAYANRCIWGHNPNRNGYGENLYATTQTTLPLTDLIAAASASWAAEKVDYTLNASGGTCRSGKVCGHYTQMIWDNDNFPTTQIGCGYRICSTGSPFGGFGPNWAIVVCNYNQHGNYRGYSPYVARSKMLEAECTPSCGENDCGVIASCGKSIDCGPCCENPCTFDACGNVKNGCDEIIDCGSCSPEESCQLLNGENTCVSLSDDMCDPASECESREYECGSEVLCGVNYNCGTCDSGEICSNFKCVNDPCDGCVPNSDCIDGECVCRDGFEDENGECKAPTTATSGNNPDYTKDFSQSFPIREIPGFTIPDTVLSVVEEGDHIIVWDQSTGVVDKYTTVTTINTIISNGEFGIGVRHGQGSGKRANDRLFWHVKSIKNEKAKLEACTVYKGNTECGKSVSIDFPSTETSIRVTMGFDDRTNEILSTFQMSGGERYSMTEKEEKFPNLGSISYFLSPEDNSSPMITRAKLVTSSTLTVSLEECIDDSEWEELFFSLTGSDPETTEVEVREQGSNANCGKSFGKALVSGFTFVVSSASVPATSLASTFVSSAGSAGAAGVGVASSSVVGGSAGAVAAGLPASAAGLGGGIGAGAGGGGGAAAGGLSGGAIAGIVIGSIGGAVLLVGVTTLVVAAVVVGAVVLASNDDDDHAPSSTEPKRRSSIRRTIRRFFGGVDVMNNPGEGHQSITARAPPMK